MYGIFLNKIIMKIKYDLTGERFGRLYVIKLDGKNKSNEYLWLCKCDCGKLCHATTYALRHGIKRSCGCITRERTSKQLEGKRFGKLTVLKRLDKKKHDCYMWLCKCDCGNTCEVRTDALTRGVTKSCGCMHITSLDDKRRKLYVKDTGLQYVGDYNKPRKSKTGFTGVVYDKRRAGNKYYAKVKFQGKYYYLGSAATAEKAYELYKVGKERIHKKFLAENPEYLQRVEELRKKASKKR